MTVIPPDERPIDLVRGWPSTTLLPTNAVSEAAQKVLANPSIAFPGLEYGPDEGHLPLREAIAAWNNNFYDPGYAINKKRITITGGASQNLGCILSVFTDPTYTRNIWIVAPAYMLAFRVFQDAGFASKLRAVPEDEKGIDLAFLRRELIDSEKAAQAQRNNRPTTKPAREYSKYYRHIIYCVPTFANPSSRTMSLDHRKSLVRLARDFDALLVADDVYDQLQWPAHPGPGTTRIEHAHLSRLVDVDATLEGGVDRNGADGFGNAMSNGSFSKICGPGMRVGWAEGSPKFAYGISQAGTTCSGGAPSQLTSTFVADLLESSVLQRHIADVLQLAYASRYRALMTAIEKLLLPLGVTMPQSTRSVVGGYFVWLTLPQGVRARDLTQRCKEQQKVIIAPGSIFEVPGDESIKFEHNIRLCFAWETEERMALGVQKIALELEQILKP